MSRFLGRYVRGPLDLLLSHAPETLPNLLLEQVDGAVTFTIGEESLTVKRAADDDLAGDNVAVPRDVDEGFPGV